MDRHDVVVIGAGVAGIISASNTKHLSSVVYEASMPAVVMSDHKAVMRLRNKESAQKLGCPAEPISVHKMVCFEGALSDRPDIRQNNLYSIKVCGEVGHRSIMDLGVKERFIIRGQDLSTVRARANILHGKKLVGVAPRKLTFHNQQEDTTEIVEYSSCISTIPMPVMARLCGIDTGDMLFKTTPIFVQHTEILPKVVSHQTVYFPDPSLSVYRATLQPGVLVCEALMEGKFELDLVLSVFGLSRSHTGESTQHTQKMGKMGSVDSIKRKDIIYRMTDEFGIYSVGRFAVWKRKRIDDVVLDAAVVAKMIDHSYNRTKYRQGGIEI